MSEQNISNALGTFRQFSPRQASVYRPHVKDTEYIYHVDADKGRGDEYNQMARAFANLRVPMDTLDDSKRLAAQKRGALEASRVFNALSPEDREKYDMTTALQQTGLFGLKDNKYLRTYFSSLQGHHHASMLMEDFARQYRTLNGEELPSDPIEFARLAENFINTNRRRGDIDNEWAFDEAFDKQITAVLYPMISDAQKIQDENVKTEFLNDMMSKISLDFGYDKGTPEDMQEVLNVLNQAFGNDPRKLEHARKHLLNVIASTTDDDGAIERTGKLWVSLPELDEEGNVVEGTGKTLAESIDVLPYMQVASNSMAKRMNEGLLLHLKSMMGMSPEAQKAYIAEIENPVMQDALYNRLGSGGGGGSTKQKVAKEKIDGSVDMLANVVNKFNNGEKLSPATIKYAKENSPEFSERVLSPLLLATQDSDQAVAKKARENIFGLLYDSDIGQISANMLNDEVRAAVQQGNVSMLRAANVMMKEFGSHDTLFPPESAAGLWYAVSTLYPGEEEKNLAKVNGIFKALAEDKNYIQKRIIELNGTEVFSNGVGGFKGDDGRGVNMNSFSNTGYLMSLASVGYVLSGKTDNEGGEVALSILTRERANAFIWGSSWIDTRAVSSLSPYVDVDDVRQYLKDMYYEAENKKLEQLPMWDARNRQLILNGLWGASPGAVLTAEEICNYILEKKGIIGNKQATTPTSKKIEVLPYTDH